VTLQDACLSGLAGAAAVEVAQLYQATRRVNDFPWRTKGEAKLPVYLFSVVLRLSLGVFAAWFCAQTGSLDVAGAVAAGVAAPKILDQLGYVGATRPPVAAQQDNGEPAVARGPASAGATHSESAEGGSTVVS
jgi:hypothetical protein